MTSPDLVYGRLYRAIERTLYPEWPPLRPDPSIGQMALRILRLCPESQVSDVETDTGRESSS